MSKKLTSEQKQDRLHRRQFEKTCRNYNLDFRRRDDQYAEYQTELAYTFYNFGRLHPSRRAPRITTPEEDEIYSVVVEHKDNKYLAEAYYQEGTWYHQHFNTEIQGKVTIA
jgi:hypothetical protein